MINNKGKTQTATGMEKSSQLSIFKPMKRNSPKPISSWVTRPAYFNSKLLFLFINRNGFLLVEINDTGAHVALAIEAN